MVGERGRHGGVWFAREIAPFEFDGFTVIQAADIDSDGHTDVLGASASDVNTIAWWRNVGGDGSQWEQHTVVSGTNRVYVVRVADFDSDGDTDFCAFMENPDEIAWWENRDFAGTAWQKHTILSPARAVTDFVIMDVNVDGNPDLAGMEEAYAHILWWENPGVSNRPWRAHTITDDVIGPASLAVVDLSKDGKLDLAAACTYYGDLRWWETVSDDDVLLRPAVDSADIPYQPAAYAFLETSVMPSGKSQFKCVGWEGTGSIPASGNEAFVGPFEFGTDSSVSWIWVYRHWIAITSSSNGTASVPSGWYNHSTTLVIHAVADAEHVFTGWQGVPAVQEFDNPLSLSVQQPESLFCGFVSGDYFIRAAAETGGVIQPSGDVGVSAASNQTFVFVADPGSVVAEVFVDGAPIGPCAAYTFLSVATNHTITVQFETETASTDSDGDGLANVEERILGTDIFLADSDGDGFGDYEEAVAGTSGTNAMSFFSVLLDVRQDGMAIVSW